MFLTCPRAWLPVALLMMAPICQAGYPTSQPSGEDKSALVARLFSELGSTDGQAREAARTGLMRLKRNDLEALRDAVARSRPLRPSQALMLRQIVQEVYLSSEQYEHEKLLGFMGVLMSEASMAQADFVPENDLPTSIGVIVSERIPGFCAARRLLDGDVILGIVSPPKAFRSTRDLQETIGGLRPGTTVRLVVLRCGQVIEVDLTLDARPVQSAMPDAIEALRSQRQKKFEDYWNRDFEPLLRTTIG
jgi:hypothetical protein